ncbi:hypothetical protein V493_00973 [Pseudogymnoascus sp. VKM F-4281 (FW-2241)]|nr:hypothetical protein V493_00973 [Pseudogymnoascus sp. VKM F-4281 (FW-2241)]
MRILKRSIVVFGTACFSKIAAVCRTKLPLLGYTPDSSSGDVVLDAGSSNVSATFVGAEVEQTHHRRAQAVEQSWSHRRSETTIDPVRRAGDPEALPSPAAPRVISSSKPTKNKKQEGQHSKPPKVWETSAQLQRFLDEEDADYRSLAIPGSESYHEAAKEERRKATNGAIAREY